MFKSRGTKLTTRIAQARRVARTANDISWQSRMCLALLSKASGWPEHASTYEEIAPASTRASVEEAALSC
eukprot:6190196-Pleurochrysis_carterae.AAC.3